MAQARDIANALVERFLKGGYFEDVARQVGGVLPAAAASLAVPDGSMGFAGLAVRCVGYAEAHVESAPPDEHGEADEFEVPETCFLYLTRSSRKIEKALPSDINGVEIHVRKVGRVQVRPEAAAATTNAGNSFRVGARIACGGSIAPAGETSAGTLGALLKGPGGALYALSNNHVIGGCNHTPVGQPVTAPAGRDAIPGGSSIIQFGTFHSLVELRSGDHALVPTQLVDAALALVTSRQQVTSQQGNSFYDTPKKTRAPQPGDLVVKTGRTTGQTWGRVEARIPAPLCLPYKSKKFTAAVNYGSVYTVRSLEPDAPFALHGDSGSLVVSADYKEALGLLFAVENHGETAWMSSMEDVLAALPGYSLAHGV